MNKQSTLRDWVWVCLLFLTPIILWYLPAGFFDDTGIILCPSVLFFNVECLGCGMTRAVMHFHHFEFDEAVFFNTGVLFVYPVLVAIWLRWTWNAVREVRKKAVPV